MIPVMFEKLGSREQQPEDRIITIPYLTASPSVYRVANGFDTEANISEFELNVTELREALNQKMCDIEERGYSPKWIIVNQTIYRCLVREVHMNPTEVEGFFIDTASRLGYYMAKVLSSDSLPMDGFIVA